MLAVPGSISLGGLLADRALAATNNNPGVGPADLQLMIAGRWAGFNLPPGIDIQQASTATAPAGRNSLQGVLGRSQTQQIRFQFGAGLSKTFYGLVQQSVGHQMRNVDGALLIGTTNALQAAYEWTNGAIFQVDMPPWNAAANSPVYATATLRATQLALASPDKFAAAHSHGYSSGAPGSGWRANNFRLSCSALGALTRTTNISSLSFSSQTTSGAFSFVMAVTAAQLAAVVQPFSAATRTGGWLSPGQATSFTIDMLSQDLRSSLGSVTLQNCQVTRVDTSSAPTGPLMLTTVTVAYSSATLAFASTWD